MVPDPMARYKQLLFFATKLNPLPKEDQIPENKVVGCVSQVWVVPHLQSDGTVTWLAESDSQLTKGLAALLVQGLSGCTPEEILRVPPTFIEQLGLQQALTPSRSNGFLNMFKLMQRKALDLMVQAAKSPGTETSSYSSSSSSSSAAATASSTSAGGGGESGGSPGALSARRVFAAEILPEGSEPDTEDTDGVGLGEDETDGRPVQTAIRTKLTAALNPVRLQIQDTSAGHAGHLHLVAAKGRARDGVESHFKVTVVSPAFEGVRPVQRHRMVYEALAVEMAGPLHALQLETLTPAEAGD